MVEFKKYKTKKKEIDIKRKISKKFSKKKDLN